MTDTTHNRICPLCEACCGLAITVRDGAVTQIRCDASDSFSQGYICPKAVALKDLHNDPNRLRTPMINTLFANPVGAFGCSSRLGGRRG